MCSAHAKYQFYIPNATSAQQGELSAWGMF